MLGTRVGNAVNVPNALRRGVERRGVDDTRGRASSGSIVGTVASDSGGSRLDDPRYTYPVSLLMLHSLPDFFLEGRGTSLSMRSVFLSVRSPVLVIVENVERY